MAFGHFCSDFVQGALAATLPFLVAKYGYSYARAASLVMFSNIIGSLIQPVFGHLSDRLDRPHLMTLGVAMAGAGVAVIGFTSSFPGLCIAVIISGAGVSMFHPQGASTVNKISDESNMGMNLGIFSFGGNAGFTLGPLLGAAAITLFGLKGTAAFGLPAVIFTVLMFATFGLGKSLGDSNAKAAAKKQTAGEDRWGAFSILGLYIICRSIIFAAMSTFLILYLIEQFGVSEALGSTLLSIYYGVSALASLFGGKLSDMWGYKTMVVISAVTLLVTLWGFQAAGSIALAGAILIPMGMGASVGYSSMVALGQKYLPQHVGIASGITLGFSVSVGGIVAPFLGRLGDLYGLASIFPILIALAAVALIASASLPKLEK